MLTAHELNTFMPHSDIVILPDGLLGGLAFSQGSSQSGSEANFL
jgi:hypothetical protein